jgi:hypothetical protein
VPEATTADPTIDEQPADLSTLDDESGTEEAAAEHPAGVPLQADAEPKADIADVNTSKCGHTDLIVVDRWHQGRPTRHQAALAEFRSRLERLDNSRVPRPRMWNGTWKLKALG